MSNTNGSKTMPTVDFDGLYRAALKNQMPSLPDTLVASLPLDFDPIDGQPYIHQSGGWTMVIACGTRLFSEVDDGVFMVGDYPDYDNDPEGVTVYEGADFDAAWAVLVG